MMVSDSLKKYEHWMQPRPVFDSLSHESMLNLLPSMLLNWQDSLVVQRLILLTNDLMCWKVVYMLHSFHIHPKEKCEQIRKFIEN